MRTENSPKYRLVIVVKEVRGSCPIYKVGDTMTIEKFYINSRKSGKICVHAFSAMLTLLSAFVNGSSAMELGIGMRDNVGYLQCPDPGPPYTQGGTVIFELKREEIKQ